MAAFYDRRVDLLVTTNIIESGLDIPTANTLIVHRADRFGLSQLYQLRGRIGRGKVRGYAYFTLPPKRMLREAAERRLQVIQSLDELGAGFQLASHDLDIRGAGNLLGDEQSGHIREVGFELYNHLLEEAVLLARQAGGEAAEAEDWTPQITIDAAALIETHGRPDCAEMYGLRAGADEVEGWGADELGWGEESAEWWEDPRATSRIWICDSRCIGGSQRSPSPRTSRPSRPS